MAARYVLGLNCYDHDVSACLLKDGAIVAAINKERVTRFKHDSGFYQEVVDYVLEAAGIPLDRVDLVVRNSYMLPVKELEDRLMYHHQPQHLTARERKQALLNPLFRAGPPKVIDVSHHLAHAYSAFAVSPFEAGAVMVVDGVGSYRADVTEPVPPADDAHPLARESESYYRFDGAAIEPLKKVWLEPARGCLSDEFYNMDGLGAAYSKVSTYIFGDWNKCGEVMGLAPYGGKWRRTVVRLDDAGKLAVDPWEGELENPFRGSSDQRWEASPHRKEWQDLAWQVQDDTETILLARARWLHEATGADHLCIAGGVALNCVANGKLLEQSPFKEIYIQPAAGDDGIAIGAACYGHLAVQGNKRTFVMKHAYLGREYDRFDTDEAMRPWTVRFATRRRRCDDVARDAARLLAEGNVIGWLQGRSEFGPRALGNRSILADPRDPKMKDHVNARVKHRQGFRPFAPAVLAERATEFFVGEAESPFMLLVKDVRPEKRDVLPAITHVDGTARVQTVRSEDNPRFHALIEAFGGITGVPVVMNTSFNLRGEPVVEHPIDAMECFLYSQLDALVIHDWLFRKGLLHRAFKPLVHFFVRARRNLRSEALMERFAHQVLEG